MFYSSEAFDIQDAFESLIQSFSLRNVQHFLASTWLGEGFTAIRQVSLERLVYNFGDIHEVYTQQERRFISQVDNIILLENEPRKEQSKKIKCSIIAVDLSKSSNPLFEFIYIMKIVNKALGGYNFFLSVENDQITFGSTQTKNNSNVDCQVAYPIRKEIYWEALMELLLFRLDEGSFSTYYRGITSLLASIILCYDQRDREDCLSISDYEAFTSWYQLQLLGQSKYYEEPGKNILYVDYLASVTAYQEQLSFIKSTKVNALELLLAAEKAEKNTEEEELDETEMEDASLLEESNHLEEILSDPIALIKKMKQGIKQGKSSY